MKTQSMSGHDRAAKPALELAEKEAAENYPNKGITYLTFKDGQAFFFRADQLAGLLLSANSKKNKVASFFIANHKTEDQKLFQ